MNDAIQRETGSCDGWIRMLFFPEKVRTYENSGLVNAHLKVGRPGFFRRLGRLIVFRGLMLVANTDRDT